jgi:HAD superfamily hydrolase (TIGR01549 family)
MQITTVLLDGGGVIVDETEFEQLFGEIIAKLISGIVPGYSIDEYYSDIEEAVRAFCPSVYKYVIWKYTKGNLQLFERLYEQFVNTSMAKRPAMKMHTGFDIEARLLSRKFKLAIAGQYGGEILDLLDKNGILDCFSCQFTQDDFTITKPDPRYLEQIAASAGVDVRECIMVGDRIDKDIIPAKQLGMMTIRVRLGLHKSQRPREPYEIPDLEIDSISGLSGAVDMLVSKGNPN